MEFCEFSVSPEKQPVNAAQREFSKVFGKKWKLMIDAYTQTDDKLFGKAEVGRKNATGDDAYPTMVDVVTKGWENIKFPLNYEKSEETGGQNVNVTQMKKQDEFFFSINRKKFELGVSNVGFKAISLCESTQDFNSRAFNRQCVAFIVNLEWKTTEEKIRNLLTTVVPEKDVISVRVAKRTDGASKGFAFATLASKEALKKVLNLNGSVLDHREIRVERARTSNREEWLRNSMEKNKSSGVFPKAGEGFWKL